MSTASSRGLRACERGLQVVPESTAEQSTSIGWVSFAHLFYRELSRALGPKMVREDAQDVRQEFYIRALRYAPLSDNDVSMRSFAKHILCSVLADHFRRRSAQVKIGKAIMTTTEARSASFAEPQEELSFELLKSLIRTLPNNYSVIIERIDINGEHREAVANSLGISCNNLGVRLMRARRLAKTLLRNNGYLRPDVPAL